ncbi:MAG: nucleotidyltransferase domain-containing protein [Anaerolineae bacterium]|nr:nucleotidyltransferase domain-containing protein [Anaerolineae bacterium]
MLGPLAVCQPEERETILRLLQQALSNRPGILFAYVHGSFLADRPFHDIDLALYLDQVGESSPHSVTELASLLEKLLLEQMGLHISIDVRVINRAPLGFCYRVFQGRLLFSRDEALRTSWVERVASRYLDLLPMRRQALKEAMTTWT